MAENKEKKNKAKEKTKSKSTRDKTKQTTENVSKESVKSIADLFGAASTDPALEALFKGNAGPLKPLRRAQRVQTDEVEAAVLEDPQTDVVINASTQDSTTDKPKKRKRKEREEEEKADDIESRYINKVYNTGKKQKSDRLQESQSSLPAPVESALPDDNDSDDDIDPDLLQHESLTATSTAADKTLFISNLPVKVLTSKSDLRALRELFIDHGRIESIRFRSIAFTDLLPRKVAFITKKLHPERDTLNAYLVYHDVESVDAAVKHLNGFVWEGKHLRVDSVAHPTAHDHKRSVFIGNLPFDVQDEDLYTHFSRCGQIEFVRVVRDKKTNIGKGFGYVQFKERDAIDKAILLNEKPSKTIKRNLRVTYAKKEEKVEIKGNVAAARHRLSIREKSKFGQRNERKDERNDKRKDALKTVAQTIVEGKRASRDKSGASGFKVSKKRGKMRLLEK